MAPPKTREHKSYRGYIAGVFSGIAKLSVGHPFDTIKVRLQTSSPDRFKGPLECLVQTVRREGLRAVYKGASPPLVGWMAMDSLMLGTLNVNQNLLKKHFFPSTDRLPSYAQGIAGIGAGITVSFIAAPIEHIKARLQVQYHDPRSKPFASTTAAAAAPRYSGPIDCTKKIYATHGVPGIFNGLSATILFRAGFFFWWGSYDLFDRALREYTPSVGVVMRNFIAGGVSAQVFWIASYPADVVKQRIMTDILGADRKYKSWAQAARSVYRDQGARGYWRGFLPCFLRAFPANAAALTAFEAAMRNLP